jgi:hypothetical protein
LHRRLIVLGSAKGKRAPPCHLGLHSELNEALGHRPFALPVFEHHHTQTPPNMRIRCTTDRAKTARSRARGRWCAMTALGAHNSSSTWTAKAIRRYPKCHNAAKEALEYTQDATRTGAANPRASISFEAGKSCPPPGPEEHLRDPRLNRSGSPNSRHLGIFGGDLSEAFINDSKQLLRSLGSTHNCIVCL